MALTQQQARDGYIIDSMALFLDRNLKQAYDAEVASLAFSTALTIRRGKPDNKSNPLVVPGIYVDTISGTERDEDYALGMAVEWRHMNFVLYCFPALVNGEPSQTAADMLKAYMRDTFGTKYIKIVDYSNAACNANNVLFTDDVMERTRKQDPIDRKATTLIAEEVHRFDMHVSIRYPVIATTAS